ncbi:DNA polymerase III subunit gamma/tau [Candidatus Peribacteria bacterium]|nr:DNA polymerase III subunit gamma/tau [Candidatus Peribacteria bacterium]
MTLYRQYRPKGFADVVGQDHIVTTLENAVLQGKLSHAYLFAGSRGTGKTSVARILAKAMLTQRMTDEKLMQHIGAAVDDGSLVDLVEIDGASNRGIDDIRSLVEKIQFTPVAANAKVYIIDEVHMLTKEAFNALLKTLEEPPAYAYFILATTELQKIPVTIQSRCQRFAFRQVPEEDIIRRLQFVADQEHITVDRTALRAIAHHSDGAVRDAISLLDQLRSLPKIDVEDVKERTGETGQEVVEQIVAALESRDKQELLAIVRRLESAGTSLETAARSLLTEVRRRLHQAIDEKQPITPYTHALTVILEALRDMRIAPVPGLVLESALLSLMEPEETMETKKSRFFSKKAATTPTSVKSPAPEAAMKATPEPPSAALRASSPEPGPEPEPGIVEAPVVSLSSVRDHWPQIVRDLSPASLKMSIKNSHVHALTGSKLILAFSSAFHRDKVAKTEGARSVEEAIEKIFKRQLQIDCVLKEEGQTPGADKEMVNLAEAAAEVF